jgi:hypothetical protein
LLGNNIRCSSDVTKTCDATTLLVRTC